MLTTQKCICKRLFTAALFLIAKYWKLYEHLHVGDGVSKLWCVHTIGSYMAGEEEEGRSL